MATTPFGMSPATPSAAARTADTRQIKACLAAGGHAPLTCRTAQKKVHAAEESISVAEARLGELAVAQDEAVATVARALIGDGLPRSNPFAAFGPLAPGALMALPVSEGAKAIHQLVAAIERGTAASTATLQATQAAEKAACAVDQALAQLDTLQAAAREARQTRDALAQTWAAAVAALKLTRRGSSPISVNLTDD